MTKTKNRLWTKDFSIIIVGSFISMLGNAAVGAVFGFLVLEETDSTFLFALIMVASMLPQLIVPLIAGVVLDRRSRKKAIFILDYITTGLFTCVALLLHFNLYNYASYLIITFAMGSISSFYNVAYESFYPNLITKGNYSKAYTISSLIYPIASVIMTPIAGILYATIGPVPIFAFAAVLFCATATIETRVRAIEPHLLLSPEELAAKGRATPFKRFAEDMKEGIRYLKKEKGLMTITIYFFFIQGCGCVMSALFLPYIKANYPDVSYTLFGQTRVLAVTVQYSLIVAANTLGRLIGGCFHYFRKLKTQRRYAVAIFVYTSLAVLDMIFLYMPYWWLIAILYVINGALAVTSFNIRISSTQNYVPDTHRARFNASFQLINAVGMILGQLIGGALGEVFDTRIIIIVAMLVNLAAMFLIMVGNRKYVKPIYNAEL
ncbi:MAG: MFS transporter [Clostridia bacterium]|nr:MFS transporter [Clostridia bacterium]